MDEETNYCDLCGKEATYFGPDPFYEEINGDDTPYWMCDKCYSIAVEEI